eukprot:s89_g6.t1
MTCCLAGVNSGCLPLVASHIKHLRLSRKSYLWKDVATCRAQLPRLECFTSDVMSNPAFHQTILSQHRWCQSQKSWFISWVCLKVGYAPNEIAI